MTKTVTPKKSLGQHFIKDQNLCRKIAGFAGIKPDDTVIEVGPGTGNLTGVLLNVASKVIGIEYDSEMISYLSSRFSHEIRLRGKLKLIHADILNVDWNGLLHLLPSEHSNDASPQPWVLSPAKFIGNLPYNISTRILSSMTETKFRFQSYVVMVQREVANRITAEPGTGDYGYFSLLMQFHFEVQRGFDVFPGSFVPKPKVVSKVIKLKPYEMPLEPDFYPGFLRIISQAFRQRRKTLWNNLKSSVADETLQDSFGACGVGKRARPEQVSLEQYLCMTRMLSLP